MALNLFKPFVISGLVREQIATNIKAAERLIDKMEDSIWPIVEEVIKEHPVLLNRAPCLLYTSDILDISVRSVYNAVYRYHKKSKPLTSENKCVKL